MVRVLLIYKDGLQEGLVSSESDIALLLKTHKDDDIILDYIDLPNGLTLIYNDGDTVRPNLNTIVEKLTGYCCYNTAAICRYNNEDLDELIDLTDDDLVNFMWKAR